MQLQLLCITDCRSFGLIVGLLYSLAVPGVWSFLRVTLYHSCSRRSQYICIRACSQRRGGGRQGMVCVHAGSVCVVKPWHSQGTQKTGNTHNQPKRPSTDTTHRPSTKQYRKGSPGVKTHNKNQYSSRAACVCAWVIKHTSQLLPCVLQTMGPRGGSLSLVYCSALCHAPLPASSQCITASRHGYA